MKGYDDNICQFRFVEGAKRFGVRWLDTAFGHGGLTPALERFPPQPF